MLSMVRTVILSVEAAVQSCEGRTGLRACQKGTIHALTRFPSRTDREREREREERQESVQFWHKPILCCIMCCTRSASFLCSTAADSDCPLHSRKAKANATEKKRLESVFCNTRIHARIVHCISRSVVELQMKMQAQAPLLLVVALRSVVNFSRLVWCTVPYSAAVHCLCTNQKNRRCKLLPGFCHVNLFRVHGIAAALIHFTLALLLPCDPTLRFIVAGCSR